MPPAAADAAGFSAEEVATALGLTKSLLVAGNLDPSVLGGEYPQAFEDLLDPKDEGPLAGLRAATPVGGGTVHRTLVRRDIDTLAVKTPEQQCRVNKPV